ncbi:MAG: hypothetical protein IKT89_03955 [Clostridia bacterium]|nr:hypothetical protein [Clostridia bacterium]
MTNKLEKQFFDTFGIEPKLKTFAIKQDEQGELTYPPIYEYPQITDRILLELICIVSERRILPSCNVNGLKEYVLKELCTMIMSEEAKHQVRTLFEEG